MKLSKELKLGIVVILSIIGFIWGISFLKGSELFANKFYLYSIYPKIDNLRTANPILVKGYKIGQVNSISLITRNGETNVLVQFLITEKINIPKNSIARAISSDLLGSKAIEVVYSKNDKMVEDGDTLIAETEQGLKESFNKQLAPIQAKAENLISSIDSVMTITKLMLSLKTRNNIENSFESVRKAILSLEKTAYKLDDLIASEKSKMSSILSNLNSVTSNLNKNEQKINFILNNLSNLSDSISKSQLKSAISNADKTIKELNLVLVKINQGEGTLGKLAKNDSLYYNLSNSAKNLDKFLLDLKQNPKRYVHFSILGGKK